MSQIDPERSFLTPISHRISGALDSDDFLLSNDADIMSSSPHERVTGHRLSKPVTSSRPRRPPSHGQSSVTADPPALRVACETAASADKRDRIDDQDRSCRAAVELCMNLGDGV